MTTSIAQTGQSAPLRRMDQLAPRHQHGAAHAAGDTAAAAPARSEEGKQAQQAADAARDRILGDLQLEGQMRASPAQRRLDVLG